ncbi:MAG TPA: IS1 family transposase [Bacteroidota bacterium]|nr:IS1 family transposase [Bacteroidota bacterium]
MANNLPLEKKALVLSLLTEGQSIRATSRIAGVSQPTILKLLIEAGQKARNFHDTMMKNVQARFMQVDEIWCYVGCKQKRTQDTDPERGDFYTFIALDADTKLVPCYRVGKRTGRLAASFMMELSIRVPSRFQLSTDSFPGYESAVDRVGGADIDYAQIHKDYAEDKHAERRYSPPQIIRVTKCPIMGEPDRKHISTSYVERQNLTVRMQMRRFTRLTNAFSKKVRNLEAAVDVLFFYYNFIRLHQSFRVTPAMEAKVTSRLWTWEELLTFEDSKVAA